MAKRIKNMKVIKPSNPELLDIAKGVVSSEVIAPKKFWNETPESRKDFLSYRREARRAIYKIIKYRKMNKPIEDPAIQEMYNIISPQINPNLGINWNSFAVNWDIHPQNIKQIVIKEHWVKEGGGFDYDVGAHAPTAFTNQEK